MHPFGIVGEERRHSSQAPSATPAAGSTASQAPLMNKLLVSLAFAFLAPLGFAAGAQAQSCDIDDIFTETGADTLTFYECTGKGQSIKAICRSVNRKKSVSLRIDGMASGNYFDRKNGFTGTWKRLDNGDVEVSEGPSLGMCLSLVDRKYLVYHAEEGDDIYPYVLDAGPSVAQAPGAAPSGKAEAFAQGLVHLKATGTEVRLRTGPGTSHQVLRKVNTSGGAAPNDELVASRQKVSGDGREWYHVLYVPAWREPEGYMPTDAWICADFVQASELTPIDRAAVDLDRFGIARTGAGRQGAPGKAPALWRGADKTHMTYVGFAGDRVLKRDVLILSSELTTEDVIETFRITSRNGGGFCAKNEEDTHYVDSSERLVRLDGWNIDELCGTIAGDKLTLSDGTVLKKFNGNVGTAFPKGVLKRAGK